MTDSAPSTMPSSSLDPANWDDFRRQAHQLLEACVDHLQNAANHPWREVEPEARAALRLDKHTMGLGHEALATDLAAKVLPYGTGNTHPRFFGWVHGTGLASGLLSEMVAAAMNSNCGGRDHGAVYVEREVVRWCMECFGFPSTASGVLVAGTSQATVIALATARMKALGAQSRKEGIWNGPRLAVYAVEGVHNALVKALELLGLGADALRRIPADATGALDGALLLRQVKCDREAGWRPFCVVGTAGSVDSGTFDRLDELADICAAEKLWLHIDGAFGAWARLADAPWREMVVGIERADSIATDFHKWMYVQYDCGLVLIRDEQDHRAAFAARPAYLAAQTAGLGGGEPWFCDYGIDLSRGFRALKVWSALRCHGGQALGQAVTRNCELAALMARLVEAAPDLRLAAPVRSNLCCFSVVVKDADEGALNEKIVQKLQLSGEVVFSTTKIHGVTVIRAAITNHRTREEDISRSIEAVRNACGSLVRRG